MCDSCLSHHNKFPLNQRHQLLDKSQFTTVNKSAIVSFSTKRCPKHPGELINVFCSYHDVVCCGVCKAFEHSTCIDTKHLPDAAKGILTSQDYQGIRMETKALISNVDKVLDSRKSDISRIAKEKKHLKQTLADFRKKVNKYFDDLEQKSIDKLDVREKTIVSEINADKKSLEATKMKAEDTLKQLETFNGDNECDLFVHVKTEKQFIKNAAQKVQEMSDTEQKTSIQFEINEDIERYVSSLRNLGIYVDTLSVKPRQSYLAAKVNASDHSVQVRILQLFPPDRFVKYRTQLFGLFNVKEISDPETCSINSICQLSDGNVVIADHKFKKIKKLNQSYTLLDCVDMPHYVYSVCPAGPGQVAVSLCLNKTIQLVSVERKLDMTTSFTVDSYCRGMSYVGGKLMICCGDLGQPTSSGCVKVYNRYGHHSIPPSPKHLPSVPLFITASDDCKHLFFTSWESDDITNMDMEGNIINVFSHKDLRKPRGICTDGRGQFFVCGYKSNTVVLLSPKHKTIDVILTEADGIKDPEGICFDRKQSRLLVGLRKSNDMLVFSVK